MLIHDLAYTMLHNICQSQEDSRISIFRGFNDGNLQFCHRLKLSAIGIYSPTEDTPHIFLGIEIRRKCRHSMTFTSLSIKPFPGGFCNVNGGVVLLENPTCSNISLCKWQ
ncbi:hypothetical protein AVEN_267149-1 [Araneus ventricosus]|uniref:Uncharacterized protein n=1 Tax=Araneus ventricosus TaxID=182803 RepID=A0A4Y2NDH9_ARAVE|nr:hypothetical protein AVEN_267149-1 [Araneus ventricosus]